MDPSQTAFFVSCWNLTFSQILFYFIQNHGYNKVHNEVFNKLDSSEFQQEAHSFIIVYLKTQPLKNGSTYENAFSKRNEPNIDWCYWYRFRYSTTNTFYHYHGSVCSNKCTVKYIRGGLAHVTLLFNK